MKINFETYITNRYWLWLVKTIYERRMKMMADKQAVTSHKKESR